MRVIVRWFIWLSALAAGLPATPAESQEPIERLSLEDAVALALQGNRRIGVATMDVQRAEHRIEAARARRLPSLEVGGLAGTTLNTIRVSYPEGAFGTFPDIGPVPSADTVIESPRAVSGTINASISQPLTQLHRIGLNTKLNELGRDAEREKLREERSATVAEVRRLYYVLVQTGSALEAKQEEVEAYRELARVVGQQVDLEIALPADGLEVKSRLANAEYELLGLRGDLATGKEQMNELLGRDIRHEFAVAQPDSAPAEELDLELATAQALERRPDLAQARLAVEQADTDRRIKKAESIPDVSLALTYYAFVNVDLVPTNIAQLGLQVKWEPFDWGRKGKERAEKELQVEQARSSARQAEDRARIEVAQRFRKLQEAQLLIEAERLWRDAADEKLRVVTSRHRHEAALLRDVLEAQATRSAARARYDHAVLNFWTAKADFQRAVGEELGS